jgi:CDP-diacylglycerol--glycerol-3-phosphate 3-phosphatidyltransferase
MRVADKFTLVRIVFAPVFLVLYFLSFHAGEFSVPFFAALIVLLGLVEFTDFFDGFFARKFNEVSDFGKVFDPFADVFLHITTFACLTFSGYMPLILFMLILYREFTMNFIRMLAAQKGVAIGARKGGKLKTVMYVVSGFFSLLLELCGRLGLIDPFTSALYKVAVALFAVCVLLSYLSFVDYLTHFRALFTDTDKKDSH